MTLLGVGGAICGASAIVAADSVVQSEKQESAVALGTITLLDPDRDASGSTLGRSRGRPVAIAISPDGRTLAAASEGLLEVRLWDLATGRSLAELPGLDHAARAVAFSPDGRLLATGHVDGTIRLWRLSGGADR